MPDTVASILTGLMAVRGIDRATLCRSTGKPRQTIPDSAEVICKRCPVSVPPAPLTSTRC